MTEPAPKKAVVITGCSSGIGRDCALYLAGCEGYTVFAGVRKEEDAKSLTDEINDGDSAHGDLRPLMLDLLDRESIKEAAARVSSETRGAGIKALVNNAGIAVAGPLEVLPLDRLEDQMRVNVVGQVAVTQAFLPLVRKGAGRIVNIGSDNGKAAWPYLGAYCASKHAIEALSDSLRMELLPWDIPVVLIQPGSIKTAIWGKSKKDSEKLVESFTEDGKNFYGPVVETLYKVADLMERTGIEPEAVSRTVAKALAASKPKPRYVVGIDARAQIFLARALPTRLRDKLIVKAIDYLGKR